MRLPIATIVALLTGLAAPCNAADAPSSSHITSTLTPVRKGIATGKVWLLHPTGDLIAFESTAGPMVFSLEEMKLSPATPTTTSPGPDTTPPPETIRVVEEGGILRWYAASAPKTARLSLLVLDATHFVAWTKQGYFECSNDGADTVVGVWSELADGRRHFIPIREFREDYWRPEMVQRALDDVPDGGAPPLGSVLPMVALVAAPTEGTLLLGATAEITVEVFSAAAMPGTLAERAALAGERGVTLVKAPRPTQSPSMLSWKERVRVPLPGPPGPGSIASEVTIPVSVPSLSGRPASLRLIWDRGWRVALPDLYVLSVGVNEYRATDVFPSLRFAAKDSQDVARTLVAQQGRRYRRVYSRVLNDREATLPRLRDELAWLKQTPQEGDVAMLFLAGHGVGQGTGTSQRYYFVPSDADPNNLAGTALSDETLYRMLSQFRAATVVLFIDSCRAGSTPAQRRLMDELQTGGGVVVYSATKANRPSLERARWQNGAFTHALVEGLRGGADVRGDGHITASGLEHFLATRVKELTDGEQEPMIVKATTDLWLAQTRPALYRRWWLWTAVGVAAAGLATGIVVGAVNNQQPPLPSNVIRFTGAALSVGRP